VLPRSAELSYETLEGVQEGERQPRPYLEAIRPGTNEERKGEIRKQLLAYCRLDTLRWSVSGNLQRSPRGAAKGCSAIDLDFSRNAAGSHWKRQLDFKFS